MPPLYPYIMQDLVGWGLAPTVAYARTGWRQALTLQIFPVRGVDRMIIKERQSTHVYRQKQLFSKEELEARESLCVHEQPAYCNAACR